MGAVLDSAKDVRQDKKNTSRQAHKTKEKLEKDKDKGVKMIPAIAKTLEGKVVHEYVFVKKDGFKGEVYFTTMDGYFSPKTGVTKKTNSAGDYRSAS